MNPISPDCIDAEEIVVEVDIEGGGVNVECLALAGEDGEHGAHHQQGVPSSTQQFRKMKGDITFLCNN